MGNQSGKTSRNSYVQNNGGGQNNNNNSYSTQQTQAVNTNPNAKYKFVNGVLVKNTAVMTAEERTEQRNAYPKQAKIDKDIPIAFACTVDDLSAATDVYQQSGAEMHVPVATQAAISEFYDENFIGQYHSTQPLNGEDILQELCRQFAQYELPIGLLSKLLALSKFEMCFLIDDSGSMASNTDSKKYQACAFMKQRWPASKMNEQMSRWEEAEDRLHVMMELIAYIPTQKVTICFLNRPNILVFERTGLSPHDLANKMHEEIAVAFREPIKYKTPIFGRLNYCFGMATNPTMFYLFTDGEPSDAPVYQVVNLVLSRKNPEKFPITFVSCTDNDAETEWMKNIDEQGPFIAEVDDFEDEGNEVIHDQGGIFPYTKGIWLCCLLVGAINPDDLDALDDSAPISKFTFENILGREIGASEYQMYWKKHPQARKYDSYYRKFASEPKCTREILGKGLLGNMFSR